MKFDFEKRFSIKILFVGIYLIKKNLKFCTYRRNSIRTNDFFRTFTSLINRLHARKRSFFLSEY